MNRARQRRRHRRAIEDWARLYEHALNADLSPDFREWLSGSGWQWKTNDGDVQASQHPTMPPPERWETTLSRNSPESCWD